MNSSSDLEMCNWQMIRVTFAVTCRLSRCYCTGTGISSFTSHSGSRSIGIPSSGLREAIQWRVAE